METGGCNIIASSKNGLSHLSPFFLAKEAPKGLYAGIIIVCETKSTT